MANFHISFDTLQENLPKDTLLGTIESHGSMADIASITMGEVHVYIDDSSSHAQIVEENIATDHFYLVGNSIYSNVAFDFENMPDSTMHPDHDLTLWFDLTDTTGHSTYVYSHITVQDVDEVVHGTPGNDRLAGGSGTDQIAGGDGDDLIKGGRGNDQLYGENGNDTLYGEDGDDTLDGGAGNDILYGGAGNDTMQGGSGNDRLIGGAGTDIIDGGAGNDVIYGGAATYRWDEKNQENVLVPNRIIGGLGADRIVDQGQDQFIYTSVADSKRYAEDMILSWTGKSIIDLTDVDANTKRSGDQDFTWLGTKSFTGHAGELRYQKYAHETFIYADVNGDKKADFAIELDRKVDLKVDSFLL
jgi:Ca2+-binding RTX toxin-like protein